MTKLKENEVIVKTRILVYAECPACNEVVNISEDYWAKPFILHLNMTCLNPKCRHKFVAVFERICFNETT